MNNLEIKPISDLLEQSFWIPSYQRGYRWTPQEVTDLLEDIHEFQSSLTAEETDFYCLQPLVVKEKINQKIKESVVKSICDISVVENNDFFEEAKKILQTNAKWEVIDGQQRLTTIFLILKYLESDNPYTLEYETRTESCAGVSASDFLSNINTNEYKDRCYDSIDFHHFHEAFKAISTWFEYGSHKDLKTAFHDILLNKVCFIWYKSEGEDAIKVFTRLNVGKISLTNAELIKALFLNRSNFGNEDFEHLKLRQNEIANEWDDIEYTLQNDDFWLFLHEKGYDRPTRIDFIFDLICEQKSLGDFKNIGNDDYKTFRYFYEYFKTKKNKQDNLELCWNKVKSYFRTFKEWFDDLELYHYVGYLIHLGERLDKLYKKWEGAESKVAFIDYLKNNIKGKIQSCKDLSKQYELPGCPSKTVCKPLLLLHNIKVTIDQNNQLSKKEEYKLPVFFKFPFHLLKKENWDVEHIDPETKNELKDEKDQKEWLKYSYLGLKTSLSEDLKEKIKAFLKNEDGRESFGALYSEIEKINHSEPWNDPEHDKNKIWNFVLLDAGTNRGYGNSIFATKRSCIIGKDQGKTYCVNDNLEIDSKNGSIAFVPPVTKNVFIKYYNTTVNNLLEWSESDAKYYKENIFDALKEFDVIDSQTINDGDNNE